MNRLTIVVVVFAVVVISVTAFTAFQVETHPLVVSPASPGNYTGDLVSSTPFSVSSLSYGGNDFSIYIQLLTPGGSLPSNTPFYLEANIILVENSSNSGGIAMNVSIDNFYINQSATQIQHDTNQVLNGSVFQSVYSSVSQTQPIYVSTQFNASVSITLYSTFGPYYVNSETVYYNI